jgi:hypothetical protein
MILDVIARARRRLLWNAMAAESARAVCTGLGLLILLLLLGTDILGWRCLLLISAATLAVGVYLTWRRLPDNGSAAQLLDSRLGLRDAISTALFFWPARPPRQFDEGMRQAQRAYAQAIAARIDVRAALPLKLPRAVYAGAALALLAGGLFGLRYGVQGRLDLKAPAAPAVAHLIEAVKAQLANLEQLLQELAPDRPGGERGAQQAKLEKKSDSQPGPNAGAPTQNNDGEAQSAQKQDSAMALDESSENQSEQGGPQEGRGDQSANGEQSARQGNNNGPQRRQDQGSAAGDSSASNSDSSLLNKARDTLANLLSAVKPQSGGRNGNPMDMESNARQQSGKSNGKPGAGERPQDAAASSAQGDQQGTQSAQQGAGSPSPGQSQGTESDKQPGSGAGRDEGDRQIRRADQLAAMGKISQILGKRSRDVTGATSVEVVSGEQELTTRYENRKAKHVEVQDHAERDEVPVELQSYVRKYFQEVRTAANSGRSAASGKSTGSASRSAGASSPSPKQK